jgi:hypothetical protein
MAPLFSFRVDRIIHSTLISESLPLVRPICVSDFPQVRNSVVAQNVDDEFGFRTKTRCCFRYLDFRKLLVASR